jgi:hypothetical protein
MCLYAVAITLRQIAHMAPSLRAHGSVVLEESWNFMMGFGEDRDFLHHLKETIKIRMTRTTPTLKRLMS